MATPYTAEEIEELMRLAEVRGVWGEDVIPRLLATVATLSVPTPEEAAKDYEAAMESLNAADALLVNLPGGVDLLKALQVGFDRLRDGAARAKALEERTEAAMKAVGVHQAQVEVLVAQVESAECERDAARQEVERLRTAYEAAERREADIRAELEKETREVKAVEDALWKRGYACQYPGRPAREVAALVDDLHNRLRATPPVAPPQAMRLAALELALRVVAEEREKWGGAVHTACDAITARLRVLSQYASAFRLSPAPAPLVEAVKKVRDMAYGLLDHSPRAPGEPSSSPPSGITLVVKGLRAGDSGRVSPCGPGECGAHDLLRELDSALAAHDAAKGGETVECEGCGKRWPAEAFGKPGMCGPEDCSALDRYAEKSRKWDAAGQRLEHERKAGAEKSHWDYAHVILTGDTPPSGPGGGEEPEEYRHVEADDGSCALTCPACLQEDEPTAPLTLESLAAVAEDYSREQQDAARSAHIEKWDYRHMGRAEGAREVLRRAANGQAPRVLLESKVVEVLVGLKQTAHQRAVQDRTGNLAEWAGHIGAVVDLCIQRLGLTLPDPDADAVARMTPAECRAELEAAGVDVDAALAKCMAMVREAREKATATRHGGTEGQPRDTRKDCTCLGSCRGAAGLGQGWRCVLEPRDAPVEPTPEVPPIYEALAFGTPEQADAAEREYRAATPGVVWTGDGVRVLADGTVEWLNQSAMHWWPEKPENLTPNEAAFARALAEAKRDLAASIAETATVTAERDTWLARCRKAREERDAATERAQKAWSASRKAAEDMLEAAATRIGEELHAGHDKHTQRIVEAILRDVRALPLPGEKS